MAQAKITWKGEQFFDKLKELVQTESQSMAKDMTDIIVQKAPVETGEYRNSIKATENSTSENIKFNIGSDLMVGRYSLAELLEFGTREMAAQPHYRPALDQDGQQVAEKMIQEVKMQMN